MHPTSGMCKAFIWWVPSHTQSLNAIHPAVCEIWKTGMHVRTCRFTPTLTCLKVIASWSLSTHQIWTQSGQPSWSYRWRGCLRHPLLGTCHVPWQAPAGIGVGQIRNLLNGDIEQKKTAREPVNPFQRYKLHKSVMGSGRVGLGWDPPPVRVLMFSLQTSYAKVSIEDEVRHVGDGYEAFCQTRGQSRDQL